MTIDSSHTEHHVALDDLFCQLWENQRCFNLHYWMLVELKMAEYKI